MFTLRESETGMTQATVLTKRPASTAPVMSPAVDTPSRRELLDSVAATFDKMETVTFGALYGIEFLQESELRATIIAGSSTFFEHVAAAIGDAGLPTDGTMGGVIDALDLSHAEVHALGCHCEGDEITGAIAASRFRRLPD